MKTETLAAARGTSPFWFKIDGEAEPDLWPWINRGDWVWLEPVTEFYRFDLVGLNIDGERFVFRLPLRKYEDGTIAICKGRWKNARYYESERIAAAWKITAVISRRPKDLSPNLRPTFPFHLCWNQIEQGKPRELIWRRAK